ncbi:DUF4158 domain-containing protein [Streptosporangium canum]|uniref:DUF4158 domain-containing protein n=1 Tax=Streptosporangium canum TaxID=324952 RepID=UPI0034164CF3
MVRTIPVEFLNDQEVAVYGSYGASVSQADLELFFYLDDADRRLMAKAKPRGGHNRLGFCIQLTTARHLGRFPSDPLEGVPTEVIDFPAGQLGVAGPSCVKRYARCEPTHREHAGAIQEALRLRDFTEVEADLAEYVARRAQITGTAPKRSSSTRCDGCASSGCCYRDSRGRPGWWPRCRWRRRCSIQQVNPLSKRVTGATRQERVTS